MANVSVCACACSQVGSLVPGPGAGRGSFAVGEDGIACEGKPKRGNELDARDKRPEYKAKSMYEQHR